MSLRPALIAIFACLLPSFTNAEEELDPNKFQRVSLKEALEFSETNNLEVLEASLEQQKYIKDEQRARAEFKPKLNVITGIGPINKAYGDAVSSTNSNVTEIGNWRALYMASVKGAYPLFYWGRKEQYIKAAKFGQDVGRSELQIKRNEVKLRVKEIYYGILLGNNLLAFVNDSISDVENIIEKIQKKKFKKSDLYRLQIFLKQLESKKLEIEAKRDLAIKGLKLYSGIKSERELHPQEDWLSHERRSLKPFNHYSQLMENNKPLLRKIKSGIEAKKLLSSAERKANYPTLGILLRYEFAYTDARSKQDSVFAYDPYNENSLIVGFGINWDLDFGVAKAKSQKINIEMEQLQFKERFASQGFNIQLKEKWQNVKDMKQKIKNSKKASKLGKKLLSRAMIGGGIGLLKAKEIVDAYEMRAFTYKEHLENIYNYNLAWADLSSFVGMEVDPVILKN